MNSADTPGPTDAPTLDKDAWEAAVKAFDGPRTPGGMTFGISGASFKLRQAIFAYISAVRTRFAGHLAGGPAEPSKEAIAAALAKDATWRARQAGLPVTPNLERDRFSNIIAAAYAVDFPAPVAGGPAEPSEEALREMAVAPNCIEAKDPLHISDLCLECNRSKARALLRVTFPAPVSGGAAPEPTTLDAILMLKKAALDFFGSGDGPAYEDACRLALRAGGASENASEDVRTAVARVLEGFDSGVFVRDTSGDSSPGWHKRIAPYVAAITTLGKFVEVRAVGGATPGAPAKEG